MHHQRGHLNKALDSLLSKKRHFNFHISSKKTSAWLTTIRILFNRMSGGPYHKAFSTSPMPLISKSTSIEGALLALLLIPECVAKGSRLTWESEARAVFAGRCFCVRNRPQPFATVRNRSQVFESGSYGPAVGESSKT